MTQSLLEVQNMKTSFNTSKGIINVVDDISFKVNKGEAVGLVGESGCGKSITALSIMGLLPKRIGKVKEGKILFNQEDLLKKSKGEMRKIIGKKIAMIFQEPMTSLNPLLTIGKQISEVLDIHEHMNRKDCIQRTLELLTQVGIDSPQNRINDYPHHLSGGMRQRIMIAMALACKPDLLIADEPTTALDVTIQAQILEIIRDIKNKSGMSVLMITHDLSVIAEMTERVMVMYAGKIVEMAPVIDIFKNPQHPYTKGLLMSMPEFSISSSSLYAIKGSVPELSNLPKGCRFSPRCDFSRKICCMQEPEMRQIGEGRYVRCWMGTEKYI